VYILHERVPVEAWYASGVVATNPCLLLNAAMMASHAMMMGLWAVMCVCVENEVEVVLCARVECVAMMAV